MQNEVLVSVAGQDWPVKKMPLGKYAGVLQALQQLPKQLEGIDSFSVEEIIVRLPNMVADSLPELLRVVSIASGVPEAILESAGLDELTDIVIAIFDVNDVEKVVDNIKKIMARKAFQSAKHSKAPARTLTA